MILVFQRSFETSPDLELSFKLRAELPGIANRALEGLRRLRTNGGKFTIGAKGRAAALEIAASQSPALRFANARLVVTGDPNDCAPLSETYDDYRDWALEVEHLGARELRSRDDFKGDLIAALMTKGIQYGRRRWHDPAKSKRGNGVPTRGFFGVKRRVPR